MGGWESQTSLAPSSVEVTHFLSQSVLRVRSLAAVSFPSVVAVDCETLTALLGAQQDHPLLERQLSTKDQAQG